MAGLEKEQFHQEEKVTDCYGWGTAILKDVWKHRQRPYKKINGKVIRTCVIVYKINWKIQRETKSTSAIAAANKLPVTPTEMFPLF